MSDGTPYTPSSEACVVFLEHAVATVSDGGTTSTLAIGKGLAAAVAVDAPAIMAHLLREWRTVAQPAAVTVSIPPEQLLALMGLAPDTSEAR